MPRRSDKVPMGIRKAKKDKHWEHVGTLGDFKGIPKKEKPGRLVRGEQERGVKLTDWDKKDE